MEQYESDSSKLEVSTTAGDGAENLEFGKGEGGPREGAEDTEPREGTIAEETLIGRPVFCHFYQHFCQSAVFISSLSMSGCATSFPKNLNHIDCVDHVDHRPSFSDYI